MEWLGQVVCLERLYEGHRKVIDAISDFYRQNGIKMLLKGYRLSRYWPKPKHRSVGIWIFISVTVGGQARIESYEQILELINLAKKDSFFD